MSTQKIYVYGSSPSSDVVVTGEGVSERHCQIVSDNDSYWIEDLLSSSGTYVDGQAISSRLLRDGDMVHLGAVAFVFADGTLTRQVKADVEQPARISESPPLSRFSPEIPDNAIPIVTPRQTGGTGWAVKRSNPRGLFLSLVGIAICGIVVLATLGSDDPDPSSSRGNSATV